MKFKTKSLKWSDIRNWRFGRIVTPVKLEDMEYQSGAYAWVMDRNGHMQASKPSNYTTVDGDRYNE